MARRLLLSGEMPHPSSLLIAVDFSTGSRTAVGVAALIARRHAATLTLLHVDRIPEIIEREAMRAPADVWESYLRDRAQSARHLLEEQASMLSGVSTRVAVAAGDVPRAILQQASRDGSDLVVLGAHGTGTVHHLWLGSTPFEVAAGTQVPALIVRERGAPQSQQGFRRPLIAMDVGGPNDAEVAVAAWMCDDDAIFHFVQVSEQPSAGAVPPPAAKAWRQALARRASWLRDEAARLRPGAAAVHFDEAESTSEAILERIEREGHDLVVVGQRAAPKPSGSLGSAARRLLEYANVSVVVTPAPIRNV